MKKTLINVCTTMRSIKDTVISGTEQLLNGLSPCPHCARTFYPNVLERHIAICLRTSKKREVFDSFKQRRSKENPAGFVRVTNEKKPDLVAPNKSKPADHSQATSVIGCKPTGGKRKTPATTTTNTTKTTTTTKKSMNTRAKAKTPPKNESKMVQTSRSSSLERRRKAAAIAKPSKSTQTPPLPQMLGVKASLSKVLVARQPPSPPPPAAQLRPPAPALAPSRRQRKTEDTSCSSSMDTSRSSSMEPSTSRRYMEKRKSLQSCVHCNRSFNERAYEAHVSWCRDRYAGNPFSQYGSEISMEAKQRMSRRINYKPPVLKDRTTRQ